MSLVLFCVWLPPAVTRLLLLQGGSPEGRPGISDVTPLYGISGAVIWSLLSICSLTCYSVVLLLLLSYHCFCFWPNLLLSFQKFLLNFFLKIRFYIALVLRFCLSGYEMKISRWYVQHAALWALIFAAYAFRDTCSQIGLPFRTRFRLCISLTS